MTRKKISITELFRKPRSLLGAIKRRRPEKKKKMLSKFPLWLVDLRIILWNGAGYSLLFFTCVWSQAPAICLQMECYQASLKLWPSTFISPCLSATTARVSMLPVLAMSWHQSLSETCSGEPMQLPKLILVWFSFKSQET